MCFTEVEYPSQRNKLRFVDKVPTYPPAIRPPKMKKGLIFMRGPELIHNSFLHKQYGIVVSSVSPLPNYYIQILYWLIHLYDHLNVFSYRLKVQGG